MTRTGWPSGPRALTHIIIIPTFADVMVTQIIHVILIKRVDCAFKPVTLFLFFLAILRWQRTLVIWLEIGTVVENTEFESGFSTTGTTARPIAPAALAINSLKDFWFTQCLWKWNVFQNKVFFTYVTFWFFFNLWNFCELMDFLKTHDIWTHFKYF